MIDIHTDRLYLTSTGRLARSLRRRFRTQCMEEGKRGWELLQAMSLNAWLDRTRMESWPEEMPAHDLYRLNLWKKLAGRIAPPSSLTVDTNLCAILDENYGIMARHGLDPASGFPSTPLVEWRREISGAFGKTLASNGLLHPSRHPVLLRRAIIEGRIACPDRISLAGFESPAPVGRDPLGTTVRTFWEDLDGPRRTASRYGIAGVANCMRFLEILEDVHRGTPLETLRQVKATIDSLCEPSDPAASRSPVEMMTIHKAKGLEFDVVFLPFLDWAPLSDIPATSPPYLMERVPGTEGEYLVAMGKDRRSKDAPPGLHSVEDVSQKPAMGRGKTPLLRRGDAGERSALYERHREGKG